MAALNNMAVLPLHPAGDQIQTSDGKRFKAIGCSDFAQFKRLLQPNGEAALVRPIIQERTTLARAAGYDGPLVARVFRHAGPWNAFGITDPWSYPMSAARDLTNLYAEYGWYVDWTGGDFQVCFPAGVHGPKGINQHNNEFCAALDGLPNAIWNTANEPFKNGINTYEVKPPPWAPRIQYSGNYDDARDKAHDLSGINLHTDRGVEDGAQKWVGKAHESAPFLWREQKYIVYDEGMGADEVTIPGRRSNVPHYFFIMGTVIAMVDLVYFHSTPGLASDGFGPIVKQCWQAFCRGAQGAIKG